MQDIPEPLRVPMTPFAIGGTLAWLLAGGVLLFLEDQLTADGRQWWLSTCLAGAALGLLGIVWMWVYDGRQRRRRTPTS